jgi:hypothetical protein
MVGRELAVVENEPEFQHALAKIAELQQPILDDLSHRISSTLAQFLPAIKSAEVRVASEHRFRSLRSCEIVIDDGSPTDLDYKGDGVQSLAALAMMRHASESAAAGKNLIVAIEEPESHLHPNAIHALRPVLTELATKHQLVLTTHCPLFVNRSDLSSTIIVNRKRARPAKDIGEVRDVLGVRSADNLRSADLVLVVEGASDRVAITALLAANSRRLEQALKSNVLAVDSLGGGTKLSYKLGLIRDAICLSHCFLDYDVTAREAVRRAEVEGLLTPAEVNYAICRGTRDSELEDMYNPELYSPLVAKGFGIDLGSARLDYRKKWSDRIADVFRMNGKHWDTRVEKQLKMSVGELVAKYPGSALADNGRRCFERLVEILEAKVASLQ